MIFINISYQTIMHITWYQQLSRVCSPSHQLNIRPSSLHSQLPATHHTSYGTVTLPLPTMSTRWVHSNSRSWLSCLPFHHMRKPILMHTFCVRNYLDRVGLTCRRVQCLCVEYQKFDFSWCHSIWLLLKMCWQKWRRFHNVPNRSCLHSLQGMSLVKCQSLCRGLLLISQSSFHLPWWHSGHQTSTHGFLSKMWNCSSQ